MKDIEKRVMDDAPTVLENQSRAVKAAKKMMDGSKSETEKKQLRRIIKGLERDIETIKKEGLEEYKRKKNIIKKLDKIKADFNSLLNGENKH